MAALRVKEKPAYIPEIIWNEVLRLHAAIDSESGHMICHHYAAGITVATADGDSVPLLALSDCTFIVVGEESVAAVSRLSQPAGLEAFIGDHAVIGGVKVETTAVALALSSLREVQEPSRVQEAHSRYRWEGEASCNDSLQEPRGREHLGPNNGGLQRAGEEGGGLLLHLNPAAAAQQHGGAPRASQTRG